LSRNPLAPARSASYTYSSRSNVVSIRTRGAGSVAAKSPPSGGRSFPASHFRASITKTFFWA
jgi:hypothetical protein